MGKAGAANAGLGPLDEQRRHTGPAAHARARPVPLSGTGVSISITSVTDAVAFILGTTSQLPALSTFCGFAAIGICADFLLQASGAHPAASWRFSARPPPPRAPSRRSSAPETCLGW